MFFLNRSNSWKFVFFTSLFFLFLGHLSMILFGGAYKLFYYLGELLLVISVFLPLFTPFSWLKKILLIISLVITSQLFGVWESSLDRPVLWLFIQWHYAELETANQILAKQKGKVHLDGWESGLDNMAKDEKEKLHALTKIGVKYVNKTDEQAFYGIYTWIDGPRGILYIFGTKKFEYPRAF